MPYDRDSGAPAYGDANTNIRVDFVYGNMPIQPNEDRGTGEGFYYALTAGDSHSIALTEWNAYPATNADPATNILINDGRTLYFDEGEEGFYWPAVGLCNTWGVEENRLETVKKELLACGIPESWLTDAQFTGGDHSYDDEEGTYDTDSGRIFYYYLDPTDYMGTTDEGVPVYGSAFDNTVVYGSEAPGYLASTSDKEDFYLVVFQTRTPGLETADWL
jgi:hypothetical protein